MIRSQAGEGRGTGTARQDNVLCGKRLLAAVGGHDPHLVLSGADPAPVEQGHARVSQPFGQSLAGGLGITLHSFLQSRVIHFDGSLGYTLALQAAQQPFRGHSA